MTTRSERYRVLPVSAPHLHFVWHGVLSYLSLSRQRRTLGQLEETQLQDVGLTKEQARAEAKRPVWDVPAHWLR